MHKRRSVVDEVFQLYPDVVVEPRTGYYSFFLARIPKKKSIGVVNISR